MSNVIEFTIKAIDDFSATMGKTTTGLSGMEKAFVAAGVAAATYAAVNLARQSLDNAEAMGTAALKANMAVETYSALAYAASQSNVAAGTLATGMKLLGKAMAEGTSTDAGKALQMIGVSATDANGKMRESFDVLMDVSDAFASATSDANKTQVALALFGRSGLDMVPMLNQGSGAINEMMVKAQKLGLVISKDFAASADQVNDNLATLGAVLSGSVNVAMTQMSPVIEQLTGRLIDLTTNSELMGEAGEAMATGMRLAMTAGIIVVGVFKTLGDLLGGVAAQIMLLAQGEFKAAASVTVLSDAHANIAGTMEEVGKIWDENQQKADASTAKQMGSMRNLNKATEENKTATEAAKKAQDDWNAKLKEASSLMDAQQTPYEQHVEKLQELEDHRAAIIAQGGDFEEMLARENEAWDESRLKTDEYRQSASDVFVVLGELMDQRMQQMSTLAYTIAATMDMAFQTMAQGIGDAVASAIIDGTSLQAAMENIVKQFVKSMISALVAYYAQKVIYSIMGNELEAASAISHISDSAGRVYAGTYADVAENMDYGWLYGAAIAAAAAAAAEGGGLAFVAAGQAAHGGLDYVPSESTFLLQQGERVLSPRQNTDLTDFLGTGGGSGGMTIGSLVIHVLENATNIDAFARMDKIQLRQALGYPVIDALNEMNEIGVRPNFTTGVK